MRAVNDFILIKKEKLGPKKVGGLILTETVDETNRYSKAVIMSVGEQVQGLKENDVIYYDKVSAKGVDCDGTVNYIIRSRDVVLVQ
tara:strand:- start:79 stop:336 length:258 start_codon:yes stop_codon:yes gene_type:complete